MNSAQYRMARGALNWTSRQLAELSGVSLSSLRRYQEGHPIEETELRRIQDAFERAGVIFVDENGEGPGVRLKKQGGASDFPKPSGPATEVVEAMDTAIKEDRGSKGRR